MKRSLIILSFIAFSIAGAGAERYNFSAVCESGQTLYYIITSSVEPYAVKVTYPQYYNYGMYLGNVTYYHNHTTPGGDLTIPDTVTNGGVKYAVKSIDDCAFYGCGFLTTITIPNSVTSIGIGAFTYCTGLTTITIPDSVTTISVETFLNCDGLTEVIIPNSVTNIDENAFKNCPNLQYNKYDNALYLGNNGNPYLWLIKAKSTDITSCEINDNCEHIYHYAFQNCQKITTITIPESVKDFGIYAFSGCSRLESVTIPNTITSIADDMFNNCSNLDFTITNYITSIGNEAFCGCSKITYVNIPNSVTNIGSRAFNDCANLKSVTIPKSVVYIGENAFVSNDITIYCEASNSNGWYYRSDSYNGKIYDWHNQIGTVIWNIKATITDDFIFYVTDTIKRQCGVRKYIGNDTDVIIPSAFSFDSVEYSVTDIGESAFYGCSSLASISIPNGVTTIRYQAFENCSGLTSINLPDSLTNIRNYAFCDCIGLTSIIFPDSLATIGEFAFWGCSGISSVIIPDKVTWIGIYAFDNCSGLAEVTIPKTVIEIQGHAFTNESTTFYCEPLIIPEKWKMCDKWNNNCEYWNNEVGTVYWGVSFVEDGIAYRKISDSVVSVRKCFRNDSFITIPQTVSHKGVEYKIESIDEEAFSDCSHIKFVLIKNHIVEIGSTAFSNSKITFYCEANDKPTNWDDGWNDEVGTVYWGVKIVDGYISHVTNASSHQAEILKYIGADSVLSIPASVTFGNTAHTVTTICESVFKGVVNLKSVTIPNTIVSIGDDAFNGCNRLPQIIIPNTVTTMGQGAFGGCSSLSIYCAATSKPTQWSSDWNPDNRPVVWGVKAEGDFIYLITNAARREVSIIKYTGNSFNVVIPSKPTINGLQCNITGIGDYAFAECGNMKQIIIPNSVQIIGNYAFAGCAELSQIIIGSGITSIGESAFSGCGAVSYIKIGNATPPTISESTFEDIDKWITVDVPCTNIDAYMNSNYWSDFVNYYEPPVYDITVNVENSKCGTAFVTRYPTCDNNQAVFNVTSNTGFAFDHWNDGNTDNPRTVAVTKDTSFTAFYSAAKINVSITTANATQGSVTDLSGIHYYSDEITISATANYGYHFTGWSDNVTTNPRTITLIKDTTIQAQFAINQYEISVNCNETERGTVSGGGSFKYLTDNTILATANYGYEFVHWSDNNTDNPRTIHLTCDTAFTAVFAPKVYELQVTSANEDLGNVAGSNSFEYKTVATVSATAIAAHHHFVQWNDGNRQNPRQVTVERDTLFVATFGIDSFNIAATYNIAMGAVSGAGLYSYGSAAKVEAKPAAHHHFVRWTNGVVQSTQEFVVEHDTAFEAVFAIDRHSVALAASDSLCGAVSGAGSYDYGASVQLQATPAANCYFTGWSDGVTTNPRVLAVEGDTNIVAEFASLPQFSIKVEAAQAERGAVSGAGEYVQGSQVTLSATAAEHYVFSQWSDGRTDNPRTVRVIADATYTAVFEPMEYYVKLAQNNANMGMVSGDGVYSYGTVVSCLATPYPNYHFVQWSNGERTNPYEFVVSEDVPLLTAYFAEGAVTAIGDESAIEPTIYAVGKTIVVENATDEICVYDAMGKLICRDAIHRVRAELRVNAAGVYIVKTGNVVMRVVVN